MTRVIRWGVAAASAVALIGSTIPAQAVVPTADPGVTNDSITIGMHLPLTGNAAPGYSDIAPAVSAYFDYVNENGGVNGRKLTLKYYDNKYPSPATARQVVTRLVTRDKVFAMFGGLGTPTHGAVVDYLNRAKVPDTFVLTGASRFNNPKKFPYTFPGLPAYEAEAKIMAKFMSENAPFKDKKVCLLTQKDDFGKGGADGFKAAKFTFAASGSYNPATAQSDIATQVGKFKAAGCEAIVVFGVTSATAATLGVAARAGLAVPVMSTSVGADYAVLRTLLGAAAPVLTNALFSPNTIAAPTDTTDPYVKLISDILTAKKQPVTSYTLAGVNNAYLLVQAIKSMGKNVTRAGLVKALERSSTFKTASLSGVNFTATNRPGYAGLFIGKYTNGVQSKISDVFETDAKNGPVRVSTFKRPAAPTALY